MTTKTLLLVLTSCLTLHGCSNEKEIKAEYNALEDELKVLQDKTATLKKELSLLADEEDNLEELASRLKLYEGDVFDIEQENLPVDRYANHLLSGIDTYETEIDKWKQAHRSTLVGLKTNFLEKADGSRITNVEIIAISDDTLTISSNGEIQEIAQKDLALPIRTKLVHEADLLN